MGLYSSFSLRLLLLMVCVLHPHHLFLFYFGCEGVGDYGIDRMNNDLPNQPITLNQTATPEDCKRLCDQNNGNEICSSRPSTRIINDRFSVLLLLLLLPLYTRTYKIVWHG